ncbi:5-oxoprolinase subunit B family protein [Streptomyces tendae]|uniref:5-oxoprolinase subunit B family protein n=1 Tax=Streptomyces tendae TaxID=1932 RepID=UPI003694C183
MIRPAGAHGLLVETSGSAAVRQITEWLHTSEYAPLLDDVVPGGRTVLIRASRAPLDELARVLGEFSPQDGSAATSSRTVEIPVAYCGEDLKEVCERAGVSPERFVKEHTGAEHHVVFFGFTPGFAYIDGVPEVLHVPRRATPRTRIATGAVAIANGFTVVYPGGTPGGWNLIGRTDLPPLWDIEREPPNLLSVGDRIVFREVR